jgi:hypothetical protein
MNWEQLDWKILDRLREGFLSGSAANGPYWRTEADLDNYDFTYAERIGWKWDAVLRELKIRGWMPPAGTILDWGCGSGIAGRRVIECFGVQTLNTLRVWDHSSLACDFAAAKAREQFPSLTVARDSGVEAISLLVVSHVLNELTEEAREQLMTAVSRSQAVIWVEPGTHAVSRDLVAMRDKLRRDFHVVAPCTHQAACGLWTAENAQHWCHAHASPPPNIYADSNWVKFGQRAGIDLRSLPYSFVVLERKGPSAPLPDQTSRVIGTWLYKGHAKLLNCDEQGVSELTLQKRTDPALFKKLDRDPGVPLYHWERNGDRIESAKQIF